jgi:hypothetical protein
MNDVEFQQSDRMQHDADDGRCLRVEKQGHVFQIAYQPGDESTVLKHLAAMAADASLTFDWFDAAVMGHQLGGELAKEIGLHLPK